MLNETISSVFKDNLFHDKTVLVSGASSGIGLELARGFTKLGAHVIALGSSASKVQIARDDALNAGVEFICLDLRDRQAIKAFAKAVPALDVLINAAGICMGDAEFEEDVFHDVIDVNLSSMMRMCTAFKPHLVHSKGSILNIASMLSYLVEANLPAYTASKTGVLGLTRALAHAYGPEGVRVNGIAPGYHKTEMTKPLWGVPKSHDMVAAHSALKRWGTTEDLVGIAVFLSTDAASFITGATLPVDGGYVVGNSVK